MAYGYLCFTFFIFILILNTFDIVIFYFMEISRTILNDLLTHMQLQITTKRIVVLIPTICIAMASLTYFLGYRFINVPFPIVSIILLYLIFFCVQVFPFLNAQVSAQCRYIQLSQTDPSMHHHHNHRYYIFLTTLFQDVYRVERKQQVYRVKWTFLFIKKKIKYLYNVFVYAILCYFIYGWYRMYFLILIVS